MSLEPRPRTQRFSELNRYQLVYLWALALPTMVLILLGRLAMLQIVAPDAGLGHQDLRMLAEAYGERAGHAYGHRPVLARTGDRAQVPGVHPVHLGHRGRVRGLDPEGVHRAHDPARVLAELVAVLVMLGG